MAKILPAISAFGAAAWTYRCRSVSARDAADFIRLPRGVAHSFENTGNVDAKVLLVVAPAGLEKFFEEAFYPVEDRSAAMPPMTGEFMARVLEAAPKVGLEFLPPPSQ